jgi:Arc/MetJ family transcription regulator
MSADVHQYTSMRTNIEIDDELIRRVIERHGFKTKREAVDYALRQLVVEPLTMEDALAMRGSGWGGDLDAIRGADRVQEW